MNDNKSNAIVLCVFAGRIYDDNTLKALKGGKYTHKYVYFMVVLSGKLFYSFYCR